MLWGKAKPESETLQSDVNNFRRILVFAGVFFCSGLTDFPWLPKYKLYKGKDVWDDDQSTDLKNIPPVIYRVS